MNIVLFLIILIILLYDVRKGIIIYAPFKFFFIPGFYLWGKYDFDLIVSIIAFILFVFVNGTNKWRKIPWLAAMIFASCCYFVSCLYPNTHILLAFQEIFQVYLFSVIYFLSIRNFKELRIAVWALLAYFVLLVTNGFIEGLGGLNVLGEFQSNYINKSTYISIIDSSRFGIHRTRSFVPHSIGFGVECAFFLVFFIFLYVNTKIRNVFVLSCFVLLSICGLFLSASRSPFLGLGVMLLPFMLDRKNVTLKNMLIVCVIIGTIISVTGTYLIDLLTSLKDTGGNSLSGSSFEMRQGQLEYSIAVWSRKPFFGWGVAQDVFVFGKYSEIFGAESIWFTLLMKRGLFGVLSYILTYVFIIISVKRYPKSKYMVFSLLGWLIIHSSTNLPGLSFFFPMMIITIMYKIKVNKNLSFSLI